MPLFTFQVTGQVTYTYEINASSLQSANNILFDGSGFNIERFRGDPQFHLKAEEFEDSLSLRTEIGQVLPDCCNEINYYCLTLKNGKCTLAFIKNAFQSKLMAILSPLWKIYYYKPDEVDIFNTHLLEIFDKFNKINIYSDEFMVTCNNISVDMQEIEKNLTKFAQAIDDLNLSEKQLEGKNIFQAVAFSVYANEMFEFKSQSNG